MRFILISLIICFVINYGCSSKTVIIDPLGNKKVITETDDSKFSESQSEVWKAYYSVLNNPPVIATITSTDGSVIKINSQLPPPKPTIQQYKNQYIRPITDVLGTGIKVIGGGLVAKEVINSLQGTVVNNTGDGSVVIDKSKNIDTQTLTDGSYTKDNSDNPMFITENNDHSDNSNNSDNSDNSVDNAEPLVITNKKETVKVVEPEVIVIDNTTKQNIEE